MTNTVLDVQDSYMSAEVIFTNKQCSDSEHKMIKLEDIEYGKVSS